jgi:hypothetical protein
MNQAAASITESVGRQYHTVDRGYATPPGGVAYLPRECITI